MKFMVFGGAFPCQLAVLERPEERYMEVALHKKGFIREFEGSWTVSRNREAAFAFGTPSRSDPRSRPLTRTRYSCDRFARFCGRAKRGGAMGRSAVSRLGERGDGPRAAIHLSRVADDGDEADGPRGRV